MADKQKRETKEKVIQTVQHGEIFVTILELQANTGFRYQAFRISRKYVSRSSNRESNASCFFHNQENDLKASISDACQYVRELANGSESQVVCSGGDVNSVTVRPGSDTLQ